MRERPLWGRSFGGYVHGPRHIACFCTPTRTAAHVCVWATRGVCVCPVFLLFHPTRSLQPFIAVIGSGRVEAWARSGPPVGARVLGLTPVCGGG